MKKTLVILMILMLAFTVLLVPALALAESNSNPPVAVMATEDATTAESETAAVDWRGVAIEKAVDIIAALCIALITTFGAWLTVVLGKNEKFKAINAAQKELINMATITVGELKQTMADKLKAASKDGKLSKDDIKELNALLLSKAKDKMSAAALNTLEAATVDVNGLILGVGEKWIGEINSGFLIGEPVIAEPTA